MRHPSQFDDFQYWNARHATSNLLTAGGDKGLSDAENLEFYAIRLGLIVSIIDSYHRGLRPLRILDAGCGNGQIAGPLRGFGHSVVGVDYSDEAIKRARLAWPRVTFVHSALQDLHLDRLFDVVLSVDVLFHIVDDAAWAQSLRALARHTKSNGTLILADTWAAETFTKSDYIVHRARALYERQLSEDGFEPVAFHSYDYGSNPIAFGVFRRARR